MSMSESPENSNETPRLKIGQKPFWKAGVREFFMLFFAVFCGFLAENYREKLADDEAEKQSMNLLAKSLESDTVELAKTIKLYKERALQVDSFISIKDLDFSLPENRRIFYKYTLTGILNSRYFKINQSGFDQLKYSGMIRQVDNPQVLESMGEYYNTYQTEILAQESDYKIWYQHTISHLMEVADYSIFGGNSSGWILVFFPKMNLTNSPLPEIKMTENQKRKLFGFAANLQIADDGYITLLEEQKKKADTLLALLNSEYHFPASKTRKPLSDKNKSK